MNKALLYSTHNYTAPLKRQLKPLNISYTEICGEENFLNLLSQNNYDLVILDSSSENNIFSIIEKMDQLDMNLTSSILFLVPGKITYKEFCGLSKERTTLGMSKPFEPKEFTNITTLLVDKKTQQDKLHKTIKELEQFTVMASHDLKTPIKNIYSYSDILLEDIFETPTKPSDEVIGSINIIRSEAKRMIQFVNDMFQFSNAGNLNFDSEIFNLKTFILDLYQVIMKEYSTRKVEICLQNMSEDFYGDKNKVSHIFQNLIENAIKYSDQSQILEIKITMERKKQREVLFSVIDNGNGMRKEDLPKIFLPFKRGRSNTKGTGIGLAIVKKLVEAYQGKIWVESSLNKGSCFYFSLNLKKREKVNEAA